VHLVENWSDIEEYARWCRYGAYQIRRAVDGIEVRVVVGKFGYIKVFKSENDELLNRILSFCTNEGFIKIVASIPEDLLFTVHAVEQNE